MAVKSVRVVYLSFRLNRQRYDLTGHHELGTDAGSYHIPPRDLGSSSVVRIVDFVAIIALVCSRLVSDMYRFC